TGSSTAAASRRRVTSGSRTPSAPRNSGCSTTTRAGATASAWTSSCATTCEGPTMTRQTITLATLAAALALAGAVHAQDATLLPAARGDVTLRGLVTDAPATPPSVERAPVHFAWALPDDAGAITAPTPYTAVSREYWKDVDGAALARGVTIHTTAPGALVLISPGGGDSRGVAPEALQVRQGGRAVAARDATVALAPQAALEAATGASFAPGALGFRLSPALGAGAFDLQVADARGRYVVHVREPDSAVALRVENPTAAYRTGDRVSLQARLDRGAR